MEEARKEEEKEERTADTREQWFKRLDDNEQRYALFSQLRSQGQQLRIQGQQLEWLERVLALLLVLVVILMPLMWWQH